MSMTRASLEYFDQVAPQWDSIRQGYFTEAVRDTAIRKAYLRPEMVVADVGAGTGFLSAGLALLVKQVYVLDGSPAMLAVARRNLAGFDNLVFQEAEGDSLPLPDESLDAVFANMYLHHIPDPLPAIREMTRLLKPGGRLVITDMDAHPYAWLKDEMADVWQGFERPQVRRWLQEAGLVNVIVDCTGESCCAESQDPALAEDARREAKVSVFVASGTRRVSGVRPAVQAEYGAAAECGTSCCEEVSSGCCGESSSSFVSLEEINVAKGYTTLEQGFVPAEAAEFSLGCGNPTALAALQLGEVVIDIGSGGGLDAFLAARQVGPSGRVIGVDMTPQMVERSRRAAQKAGFENVEFREGYAEALPIEEGTGDVVISNCVINLTEDKGKVFDEIYRVLKGEGRLEVSDVVTSGTFPLDLLKDRGSWSSCVSGALPEQEYLDLVAQAGFKDVRVRSRTPSGEVAGVKIFNVIVSATKS